MVDRECDITKLKELVRQLEEENNINYESEI